MPQGEGLPYPRPALFGDRMETLLTILIFGLATSGIYALMAIGVALIYGVGRVINFAHGPFYTLGAYFTYVYATHLGIGWWGGAVLSVLSVSLNKLKCDFPSRIEENMGLSWRKNP